MVDEKGEMEVVVREGVEVAKMEREDVEMVEEEPGVGVADDKDVEAQIRGQVVGGVEEMGVGMVEVGV